MESNKEFIIRCGSADDSYETLRALCEEKAEKLCETIDMPDGVIKEYAFWTDDFPELICIGMFSKGKDGHAKYELDFSQGTL